MSPCAGLVPGPDRPGRAFAATWSVKTEWFEQRLREAPGSIPRLSTTWGQPSSRAREQPIDGRHLGCGGSRYLFAEVRVKRPWVLLLVVGRGWVIAGETLRPRHRPRDTVSPPRVQSASSVRAAREAGTEGGPAGSARAGLEGWDRRGVRPACRTCWAGSRWRRALRPALPRSHDRRCPSGSGWGEAPAACALRSLAQEAPSWHGGVIRHLVDGP